MKRLLLIPRRRPCHHHYHHRQQQQRHYQCRALGVSTSTASIYNKNNNDHQSQTFKQSQQFQQQKLYFSSSTRIVSNRNGLFSIPELQHPSDFFKLTKAAIIESDDLRNSILPTDTNIDNLQTTMSPNQVKDVLYQLDHISRSVCNVIDAAELCRSTHANEEWRIAASQAFDQLQSYIATLNADDRLYQALSQISKRKDFYNSTTTSTSTFTQEEQRFCMLLQREFELDGIHLPKEQRRHVQDLHHRVSQLETLFANNITNAIKPFQVPADVVETVLPKHVLEANGAVYDYSSKMVQLYADTPITHSLSSFANNGQLRKQIHMETTTKCPENLDVLNALIAARHELATSLGFPSFAHRFLQDKMAGNPQNVIQFLQQIEKHIRPTYQKELSWIQQAKQHVEGNDESNNNGGTSSSSSTVVVEPWDIKFYVKLLKAQSVGVDIHNELSKYWSLSNSLSALQILVQELFGIEMQEQPIGLGERWDIDDDSSSSSGNDFYNKSKKATIPTGDKAIRKFTFVESQTQRPLGTMYLDLHPRKGKYTHAAHFTVRCGCVVKRNGINNNNNNHSTTSTSSFDGDQDNYGDVGVDEYQLPIVALVCNMNLFASHQEVETLFHEFGHALHSLLSRTNFQHLSGTRGAMDFVETPSHWMEHFVWDPTFLTILARDPADGSPMPKDKIQALVQSRNAFRCLEMQNQIVLSLFDQTIFGVPPTSTSTSPTSSSTSTSSINPLQIWEDLHRQYSVPYAKGTHWYSNVGHLVTYGAGYYGYLYSQVFADAIWNQLFQKQCLNRTAGENIWKKVLIHGGSRDANLMLEDLLGKKPTVENFFSGK